MTLSAQRSSNQSGTKFSVPSKTSPLHAPGTRDPYFQRDSGNAIVGSDEDKTSSVGDYRSWKSLRYLEHGQLD